MKGTWDVDYNPSSITNIKGFILKPYSTYCLKEEWLVSLTLSSLQTLISRPDLSGLDDIEDQEDRDTEHRHNIIPGSILVPPWALDGAKGCKRSWTTMNLCNILVILFLSRMQHFCEG